MLTEEAKKNAKESRKRYDAENLKMVGTKMKKEKADAFTEFAESYGMHTGSMLGVLVQLAIDGKLDELVAPHRRSDTAFTRNKKGEKVETTKFAENNRVYTVVYHLDGSRTITDVYSTPNGGKHTDVKELPASLFKSNRKSK